MDLPDAFALAEHLLARHGPTEWSVEFDSAKRRAGICRFADRVIGLSAPLTRLHSVAEVEDTVLHEIAHALVGPRHGHDETWRRVAREIGSSGARCVDADSPRVVEAWLGTCPAGHTVGRHRRPERVVSCPSCHPTFDPTALFAWTHHGRPAVMHPNYEAELAALRRGERMAWIAVGSRARVTVEGEHHGVVGRVVKRGRTSYHLKSGRMLLRVPFAWVEPVH